MEHQAWQGIHTLTGQEKENVAKSGLFFGGKMFLFNYYHNNIKNSR
jgi:hypothetical protein